MSTLDNNIVDRSESRQEPTNNVHSSLHSDQSTLKLVNIIYSLWCLWCLF